MVKPLNHYKTLVQFVNNNKCFCINQNKLFCNICNVEKKYIPGEGIRDLQRHINSNTHQISLAAKTKQTRLELDFNEKGILVDFHLELLEMFVKMNIPLYKMKIENFINFISKYTGRNILSESTYRKVLLEKLFEKKRNEIRDTLKITDVYILFDETTDTSGRYVLNIIAGACSVVRRETAYLIKTVELNATNALNVNKELLECINWMFSNMVSDYDKLKLLVSDGAPYAIKAGNMLKEIIPNLKHVVCLCHNLHNLCETIRSHSPNVNSVVVFLKKVLTKNFTNRNTFISITNLCIPKFPAITRWGTWLEFTLWIFENFMLIKTFVEECPHEMLNRNEVINILNSDILENELRSIKSHSFLCSAIKVLQNDKLSTEDQIKVLKDVISKVDESEIYSVRLKNILKKNPDINFFLKFNMLKVSENDRNLSYIPLTSVPVERSFSKFKQIFSDQRQSLTIENMEMYLTLNFNE